MSQLSMDASAVSGVVSTSRALIGSSDITRQEFVDIDGNCWDILVFGIASTGEVIGLTWSCHEMGVTRALSRGVIQEADIDTVVVALEVARLGIEAVGL